MKISQYYDDILVVFGCGLIIYGTWSVAPGLVWFVAGAMMVILGILVGIGRARR